MAAERLQWLEFVLSVMVREIKVMFLEKVWHRVAIALLTTPVLPVTCGCWKAIAACNCQQTTTSWCVCVGGRPILTPSCCPKPNSVRPIHADGEITVWWNMLPRLVVLKKKSPSAITTNWGIEKIPSWVYHYSHPAFKLFYTHLRTKTILQTSR